MIYGREPSINRGFSIVELLIVIVVIAIIASLTMVTYRGVTKSAAARAAQSDLDQVATEMQKALIKTGEYPTTLPTKVEVSEPVELTMESSGEIPLYSIDSPVQNGVLLSQICQDLIDEGAGKAVNQGGDLTDYITGCGNWNHDSMQVTGWNSRVWDTPVTKEQLLTYGNSFTTNDNWNKAQENVVRTFYNSLVSRLVQQGGNFPVTSFWDSWATPTNGGVQQDPLETDPRTVPYYCVEARGIDYPDVIWHVTEISKITNGPC